MDTYFDSMTLDEMVDYLDDQAESLGLDPIDLCPPVIDIAADLEQTALYIRKRRGTEDASALSGDEEYLDAVHYLEIHRATGLL